MHIILFWLKKLLFTQMKKLKMTIYKTTLPLKYIKRLKQWASEHVIAFLVSLRSADPKCNVHEDKQFKFHAVYEKARWLRASEYYCIIKKC